MSDEQLKLARAAQYMGLINWKRFEDWNEKMNKVEDYPMFQKGKIVQAGETIIHRGIYFRNSSDLNFIVKLCDYGRDGE